MSKTKTISARVPLDIAEMVENACKHKGVNKSQLITNLITNAPNQPMARGGAVKTMDVSSMPDEIKAILSAGGGLGVGMLVHNVLEEHLPYDRFKNDEVRENVIMLCAIAVGMGTVIGLTRLLKNV